MVGLEFHGGPEAKAQWETRALVTAPLNIYLMTPGGEISFDLSLKIEKSGLSKGVWSIDLPPADYRVRFTQDVDPDLPTVKQVYERYIFEGSRMYHAVPWKGCIESNEVTVPSWQ